MNHFKVHFSTSIKAVLIFLLFIGSVACKSTESVSEKAEQSTDKPSLEEIYWEKIQSSRMSFTKADVDFMTGMIGHHAQALIISELAPENNASAEIQVLAARIINAQHDEIASMQQWLADRDQPVPEIHIDGLNLMIHGLEGHGSHADHTNMPGMLSQDQINELSEVKGSEFDRLFLEYMIEHHNGAVIMVNELFETDGAVQDEEAFRLAADIQVDQITEIERMRMMLEKLSEQRD